MTDAESLYDTTKNMADQALRKAQDAYDDSLDIFSTAESIVLPDINVDIMKDDAKDIKDEVSAKKLGFAVTCSFFLSLIDIC